MDATMDVPVTSSVQQHLTALESWHDADVLLVPYKRQLIGIIAHCEILSSLQRCKILNISQCALTVCRCLGAWVVPQ